MGTKFAAITFTQHCCGGKHSGGKLAEVRGRDGWLRIRIRRSNGEIVVTQFSADGSQQIGEPTVMTEAEVEALLP